MDLIAYLIPGHRMDIQPGEAEREWMNDTPEGFAYRCLPLNIANMHGWEIRCPKTFRARWTGGTATNAIEIQVPDGANTQAGELPVTHFGSGILTFHVHGVIRTPPGINLMAMGPINRPKHGIAPLTGVIETDWSPYSFTMNWMFTAPNIWVEFEAGEPFVHLLPVPRGLLEQMQPKIRRLDSNPELAQAYRAWQVSRDQFNADLTVEGSEARKEKWQKLYYRGLDMQGGSFPDHQIKLRLPGFVDETGN
jgi:hypothetical protein